MQQDEMKSSGARMEGRRESRKKESTFSSYYSRPLGSHPENWSAVCKAMGFLRFCPPRACVRSRALARSLARGKKLSPEGPTAAVVRTIPLSLHSFLLPSRKAVQEMKQRVMLSACKHSFLPLSAWPSSADTGLPSSSAEAASTIHREGRKALLRCSWIHQMASFSLGCRCCCCPLHCME